uniref:cytosolic sulfotransferase 11-like n=1 Tax=Erigeron canadensis TaxID=72917 RepID=UPI001CB9C550|nr:cytosolic sulfotransferase 11-like [Erigeron canadensis]
MMSNYFLSTTPKTKEEEEEYNFICQQHNQLIKTSPKGNGWRVKTLYNYKGFWINPNTLKTNLILHSYFKCQPTDIILASFMKSGTTWLKALMFSTLNRDRYTFSDHHLLRNGPQSTFPFIDCECYPISDFTHLPKPRLFATHFARALLPPCMTSTCKFVYVCRDPKDVLISKWHFMKKLRSTDLPPLTLEKAFSLFCQGVSEYGPFWEHVLSYWKASLESPDKILFLKYEEIMKKPEVVVRKLAEFMGKPFVEDEEEKGVVNEIVKLCSFENLSNLEVNKNGVEKFGKLVEVEKCQFFRKGEIGDWKNYLSKEMKECIDGITHEKLKGSGLVL